MAKLDLTPKKAFYLSIGLGVILLAMGIWWTALMAQVMDEKVELAEQLGADTELIEHIQDEEISRQIMVGMEGLFFLLLIGIGTWLIYRAMVRNEELSFNQQNFLMAVTHELKTPLASMRIYLDTLKSEKIPPEKKIDIIPKIKDDVERLEKLVENILEAGRFERSNYKLNKEQFDLSLLFSLAVEKLEAYKSKKQFELNKNIQENLESYGDPHAIGRAFDAILENSIKYNDKDIIKIDISLKSFGHEAIIKIKDNGFGLEKENFDRIFDRFYRVGNELNRSKPGSGLGLYLAREIMRAHDGDVEVLSDGPGKGCEFLITMKAEKYENNSVS